MKHLILSIALFLYSSSCSIEAYSQGAGGDFFLINEDNSIIVEFEITCVSIPFEGLNYQLDGLAQYNRVGVQQNGSSGRIFDIDTVTNYNDILRYKFAGGYHINFLGFLATADLQAPVNGKALPLGKFKITVKVQGTDEKYSLYFNNLDSKYGTGNWHGANIYGADWYVRLRADLPAYNRLAIHYTHGAPYVHDTISSADTLANGEPSKEFKVWDILYDREDPWEKNFYARSNPFPVKDSIIDPLNVNLVNEFILGTTVTFDTVYPNLGVTDKYGYNTIPSTDFYFNQIIDSAERGNHMFTPGVISTYHYHPAYPDDNIYTCKVTATAGDTLIVTEDKHFWVNGTNNYWLGAYYGDTLIFDLGSHLTLKETASMRAFKNGSIIDKGGIKHFDYGSFVLIKENSFLIIDGSNVTYPANARVEVEANGYLILKDNATLIFDGEGATLDIHPDANLILGENSRIEFRNGAYLDAEGITFEGNNGATWDGLVFHNAGGQTQIKNCTFKDAKISIDIKNTTGCYADLEKRIIDNTFIQSGASTHSIQAENIFKLLLRGNTFNLAPGKTGVEINNTINAGPPMAPGGGGESSCINTSYALNILENTFNNGKYQLYLNCYASQVTPFWVFNNIFNSSSTTNFSLIGRKITGDLKMNNFIAQSQVMHNVLLMQSSVNMLDNTMNSQVRNIVAGSQSIWKMAPIYQNNQWIWLGGYNRLSSQLDNIEVTGSNHNLPLIDKGRNCFTIPTNQGDNKFHIIGHNVPWNVAQHQVYYMRENAWTGWMGNNPVINIRNQDGQYINYYYQPVISCPSTAWSTYTLDDKGFGIYDTVYYLSGLTGSPDPEPDEGLYYRSSPFFPVN